MSASGSIQELCDGSSTDQGVRAEFDPQPFHLDEAAAEASVFKGLAASGWHTAAAAMRLLRYWWSAFASGIVGLGGEIAWPKPTRPGDTFTRRSEIVEITPIRSSPIRAS